MAKTAPLALICLLFCLDSAAAREDSEKGRWVTFQVTRGDDGRGDRRDHQIDRNSIRQEGAYKTFWTRAVIEKNGSFSSFNDSYNYLHVLSQKYAVDCKGGKMGARFIDSNMPAQARMRTPLRKMTWKRLDRYPAVAASVCGIKD